METQILQNVTTTGGVVPVATPGAAPSIDPTKELWIETRSEAGKVYFYSAKTRKTAWTKPQNAQVISQRQFLALALTHGNQAMANSAPAARNAPQVARFAAPVGIPQFLMQMAPSAG